MGIMLEKRGQTGRRGETNSMAPVIVEISTPEDKTMLKLGNRPRRGEVAADLRNSSPHWFRDTFSLN
jgi:hypothetical protein